MEEVVTCPTCGLVQRMDAGIPEGSRVTCARCNFVVHRRKPDSRTRTFCLALAAFILYWPANLFPIVITHYWGREETTTIFQGIKGLFLQGNYFVGSLVFTTSILSPGLKILGLLFLAATLPWPRWKKPRTWVYKIIQIIDPWNMLEVTLLAMLVSIAELGKVATVHPGAGVFSFAAVVVLTICATITFDTRVRGGIAFATPDTKSDEAYDGAEFRLYSKPESAWQAWFPAIKLPLIQQPSLPPPKKTPRR